MKQHGYALSEPPQRVLPTLPLTFKLLLAGEEMQRFLLQTHLISMTVPISQPVKFIELQNTKIKNAVSVYAYIKN